MGLANILGGIEFECTCNTGNNKHPRGMVNSATPFCLGQCHSSTASLANNRLLFSTLVLRSLFSWRWKSFRSSISCKTFVFFRLDIFSQGNLYKYLFHFQTDPNHNRCRKLPPLCFLWFLPRYIDGSDHGFRLRPIETNHWGSFYNLVQMYLRRKVDTKHCLYQRCIVPWNKMYTLFVSVYL